MSAEIVAFVALIVGFALLFQRMRAAQPATVQGTHLTITAVNADTVSFADGRHCAVLEIGSVNFALLSETQQRELVTSYAALLDSLTFPIQVLSRATPLDLDPYLATREAHLSAEPQESLRRLGTDLSAFLRQLASGRTLLERHCYVIIAADSPTLSGRSLPFSWLRQHKQGGVGASDQATAVKQLAFRCDDLIAQFSRCGLIARRLTTPELARLHYDCWCPELARTQRLHDDHLTGTGITTSRKVQS